MGHAQFLTGLDFSFYLAEYVLEFLFVLVRRLLILHVAELAIFDRARILPGSHMGHAQFLTGLECSIHLAEYVVRVWKSPTVIDEGLIGVTATSRDTITQHL